MPAGRLAAIALFLAAAAAGCGGAKPAASTGPSIAPGAGASRPTLTRVAGTDRSAQDVATAASGAPGAFGPRSELSPLSPRVFRRPIARWRLYAAGQAAAMHADAAALAAALEAGDRAAARTAWASAYDHFVRIGAAYGALGGLGEAIGGMPGRLSGGVGDPRFTGLHRIEHGLWRGAPASALAAPARRLMADTVRLERRVRTMPVDPLDYVTRAHEILEDAERDQLSGAEAPWSGAGLRTTADALAATRVVLGTLRPLLRGRGDALTPVQAQLDALSGELAQIRRAHAGALPVLDALRRPERERVDGRVGAALEALAAVPGALETQLPPVVPPIPAHK
jgi:iron uptake system EfeUOB component EfeO/EfeM